MRKDERLYARFDIGMDEHPKIMLLSDAAFRALIEATLYARRQLTDGFLDERVALKKWGRDVIEELASNHDERPTFERVEGGWMIRDYEQHQTTRADIEAKREAGRAGGLAKAKQAASKPVAPATAPASNPQPDSASTRLAKTETETETKTLLEPSAPAALTRAFDEAWGHWPKKVERKKAADQWKVAVRKLGVDAAVECVTRFGDAYAATTEKQFVPALGVWLRGERWTDELPQRRADNRGSQSDRTRETVEMGRQLQAELDALSGFELKGIA